MQKSLVTNAKVIDGLKAKLKASVVVEMIRAVQVAPNKAAVDKAYEAYSTLSAEEKLYVENFDVLDAVNKAYRLQEEELGKENGVNALPIVLGAIGGAVVLGAVVLVVILRKRRMTE